jgi:hypothetical protein
MFSGFENDVRPPFNELRRLLPVLGARPCVTEEERRKARLMPGGPFDGVPSDAHVAGHDDPLPLRGQRLQPLGVGAVVSEALAEVDNLVSLNLAEPA